jgi:hypothetical protein
MKDITRRDFLGTVGTGAASLALAGCAGTATKDLVQPIESGFKPSDKVTLKIKGAVKPFDFVHITDVHLCQCDSRNPELIDYLAKRKKDFRQPEKTAKRLFKHINTLKTDFIAVTGDYLDVPTQANLELGGELLNSLDTGYGFSVGNHEWADPAIPPDRDYWRSRFSVWTPQPMDWFYRRMNGVNMLFLDDSDYQITEDQLKRTKALLDTGRPCILFVHIPIIEDSLLSPVTKKWGRQICLGGQPGASQDLRRKPWWKQLPEVKQTTKEFLKLIKSHPQMNAIFAGHLHFDHKGEYQKGCHQYVTGGAYGNVYRKIEIVPG